MSISVTLTMNHQSEVPSMLISQDKALFFVELSQPVDTKDRLLRASFQTQDTDQLINELSYPEPCSD